MVPFDNIVAVGLPDSVSTQYPLCGAFFLFQITTPYERLVFATAEERARNDWLIHLRQILPMASRGSFMGSGVSNHSGAQGGVAYGVGGSGSYYSGVGGSTGDDLSLGLPPHEYSTASIMALAGKDWGPHLADNSLALRWNKVGFFLGFF